MTLASRILGLLRDAVIAAYFRRGATDAFFVAFTIPNVLRRLLAEGALTVAFIPVLTECRQRRGEAAARELLAATLGAALVVWIGVCLLGIVFAPLVVQLFAYGFNDDPPKLALAVLLTRLMFPFLLSVGLVALAMGALNADGDFAAPAVAPAVLNLVIIAAILTLAPWSAWLGWPPIATAAVGVLVGGVLQAAVQLPSLRRRGLLVRPTLGFGNPEVRRIGALMVPSIFGLAVYQLNVILMRQFASFLPEGVMSAIYYAQRLIEFPLGIFAVAVATVTMPGFSAQASAGEFERLKRSFNESLRLVLFVMLPASSGLVALALPLTAVLFQRGAFTHAMAHETASMLVAFSAGMWAAGGVRQTVPVFFALQDTRTPVVVSLLSLLIFVAAALGLRGTFAGPGLALAVAISSVVNFALLLLALRRRLGRLELRTLSGSMIRGLLASAGSAAAAAALARLGRWEEGSHLWLNHAVLLAAVLVGALVFFVLAVLLRCPELQQIVAVLRRRRARR
ncbi:MAG: murein biosynthesis integral membrane protein MurJ [Proteobacteria bacterium]|nr:murein biosynthesis integral membrane protein MurJ [Pseudomonadota bacterium]